MPATVDYFVTMISPWTFLGHRRFLDIAARHGARVALKPVHIGSLFERSGGVPATQRPRARKAYRMQELARWTKRLGVAMNIDPPHFPVADVTANRMVIAADREGSDALALAQAIMAGVWTQDRDISDPDTLRDLADAAGADGGALLEAAASDTVKQVLRDNTDEAVARGAFGVPTYMIGGQVFWGQDRLDFVDEALAEGR